ncbi:MAG: SH3 domain-containing protein [Xanthobacteraceae bacterium]
MLLIATLLAGCSDSGTAANEAKLRQTPTNASKVLATIPRGSAIKIGDCSNGWCRVWWSGREGYVLAKSVHISERAFRNTSQPDQAPDENDAEEENVAPSDEGAPPSTSN